MDIILRELFSTDYGLFSLIVITLVIVIGAWFSWWFKSNIDQNK